MVAGPGHRVPRRFRRRLLVALLVVGLLSTVTVGIVGSIVTREFLSVSLEPLSEMLDRVEARLNAEGDVELVEQIQLGHVHLLQAELARKSLLRVAPVTLLGLLAVLVVTSALLAFWFSRSLADPIENLTRGMQRYARGDLEHRIPDGGARDELRWLVRQFNTMGAELLAQRERLQATEEIAARQKVARTIAHELKNPLTAMRMAVARCTRGMERLAIEGDGANAFRESLELVDQQIGVLHRLARNFSEYARLPPPDRKATQLRDLVRDTCSLYENSSPVELRLDDGDDITLECDTDQLRRAIGNLLKNAIEASGSGAGPIEVSVEVDSGAVRIVVADGGEGIAEPLSGRQLAASMGSTKEGGSGLGLPIAYKIVHDHGGSLRIEPRSPTGTRAVIELPLSGT